MTISEHSIYGAYVRLDENEALKLADYLDEQMVDFWIDLENESQLREPGKNTILFGQMNRYLIRNILEDYGFEVVFDENLTISERAYEPPVARLLTLGEPSLDIIWPAGLAQEFGSEHLPALIRMAGDQQLHTAASTSKAGWAPIHAWRILGLLRAESAIMPLVNLLHRIDAADDDDWADEELPLVFALIGPAAIPPLGAFLDDPDNGEWSRVAAANALEQIGRNHAPFRAECVARIVAALDKPRENSPTLNGFLIASLLDFKVVEAAPAIERAFAAEQVDEFVAGDWEDVQIELGLKAEREHPRETKLLSKFREEAFYELSELLLGADPLPPVSPPPFTDLKAINKAQKKKRSLEKKNKKKKAMQKPHQKH